MSTPVVRFHADDVGASAAAAADGGNDSPLGPSSPSAAAAAPAASSSSGLSEVRAFSASTSSKRGSSRVVAVLPRGTAAADAATADAAAAAGHSHGAAPSGLTEETLLQKINMFRPVCAKPEPLPYQVRVGRISTWLYMFLLGVALALLVAYLSVEEVALVRNLKHPSLDTYLALETNMQVISLDCPCTNSVLKYEAVPTFVQPRMHQLCGVLTDSLLATCDKRKFPTSACVNSSYADTARGLQRLCSMASLTVSNAVESFKLQPFSSPSVMSPSEWDDELTFIEQRLFTSITSNFGPAILLANEVSHINRPYSYAMNPYLGEYTYEDGAVDDSNFIWVSVPLIAMRTPPMLSQHSAVAFLYPLPPDFVASVLCAWECPLPPCPLRQLDRCLGRRRRRRRAKRYRRSARSLDRLGWIDGHRGGDGILEATHQRAGAARSELRFDGSVGHL
jgi:hypothetical protein